MTKPHPKNMSASVKNRLLTVARENGDDFNLLLIRYGIERLLYRLSKSAHGETFVLKGAILFHLWADAPHRPTRDVDFLCHGSPELSRMEEIFQQVVQTKVEDDGLVFDAVSVQAERIKEDQDYEGIRVHLEAKLGSAKIRLQIDIGFGDAITPMPSKRDVPCILDFEAPKLAVYPWETVVAEKYQAVVNLGMTNSRMKDFFDLRYLAREMAFDGQLLARAIRATFDRRKTDLPTSCPVAFTRKFSDDAAVGLRWGAFIRRSRLDAANLNLQSVSDEIWSFLGPVTDALCSKDTFEQSWKHGGPWE